MVKSLSQRLDETVEQREARLREKPPLYWSYHTIRADKWRWRRLKKKSRLEKERAEGKKKTKKKKKSSLASKEEPAPPAEGVEAAEAEAENTGGAAAEEKKRKLAEGEEPQDAQDTQEHEAAVAEETAEEAQVRKKRKRKQQKVEREGATAPAQEQSTTADAQERSAPGNDEVDIDAAPPLPEGTSLHEAQRAIHPEGFFSEMRFQDLVICDPLKKALKENGFEVLTEIQAKSIPHLLAGKDVLAAAKTGSGKTLAFLIPATDMLYNVKFLPRNGLGALVVSPTRELAQQIYDVLRNVSRHMSQTFAVVVGGVNRRPEADKLGKGVNTLVATPGRLLDHMQNTKGFVYHNLVNLTIDEADRILEVGFEEEMNAIIGLLPKKRQTALFSATQTRKVADLARLSLTKPVLVEVKSQDSVATVSGLTQGYVVCPANSRFLLLFTFLKRNRDKKIMVFFSACNSVKFHDELLNYIDIPVSCIHGQKKQAARSTTYYSFCAAEKGILLCTDVAARGLDIPRVDWIVQYDPPDEPKEYIHRVGRTARGADGKGKALLFLMPEELAFLQYLRAAGIPVSEYTFPPSKIANIQNQLERVIEKNYHLFRSSRDAYRSYMHAYAAHGHKDCFDVYKLDLALLAKAFGFSAPPKVDLNLNHTPRKKKKLQGPPQGKLVGISGGHSFSAANPYGGRAAGDNRQFMR